MQKYPVVIEVEADAALTPADAPPPPDQMPQPAPLPMRGIGRLGVFLGSFALLVVALFANALWGFVADMMARGTVLGQVALVAVGVFVALGLWVALGEALAYLRMGRVDALRARAQEALRLGDVARARAVVSDLARLQLGRGAQAEALLAKSAEMVDAAGILAKVDAVVMVPLDRLARGEIVKAARAVASASALVPIGAVDLVVVLAANLRMIRRLSEIYGGRSGVLGSMRLLRAVVGHLMATGALALGDDVIGAALGGSLAGKLSRRLGEGVVNGALTARLGLIAMELCRPLPLASSARPNLRTLLGEAFLGIIPRAG